MQETKETKTGTETAMGVWGPSPVVHVDTLDCQVVASKQTFVPRPASSLRQPLTTAAQPLVLVCPLP